MSIGPLPLSSPSLRLLVLTGAGVSAESGLATFRGAGGRWLGEDVAAVATPTGFAADPARVWTFHARLRAEAAAAAPNAAHRAIAALPARMGDRMLLVTQNIDGLHQRAGHRDVVELHGSLARVRCSRCDRGPLPADGMPVDAPPACDGCGAPLRPAVTWFGEDLDPANIARIRGFIRSARRDRARLALLAVGTSGTVWPASALVSWVRDARGATWLVNLEPPANAGDFHSAWYGPAGELLPRLLG